MWIRAIIIAIFLSLFSSQAFGGGPAELCLTLEVGSNDYVKAGCGEEKQCPSSCGDGCKCEGVINELKNAVSDIATEIKNLTESQNQDYCESETNNSKECRDLRAQETMAKVAWPLFWVGLAGFALSSAGLIALIETLRQTRNANRIASEGVLSAKISSEKQLRPYLAIKECSIAPIEAGEPITIVVVLKNYGQTPIYNLGLSFDVKFHDANGMLDGKVGAGEPDKWVRIIAPEQSRTFYPEGPEIDEKALSDIKTGRLAVMFEARARYEDNFRHIIHYRVGMFNSAELAKKGRWSDKLIFRHEVEEIEEKDSKEDSKNSWLKRLMHRILPDGQKD